MAMSPPQQRRGFYLPAWAAVTVAAVMVLGIGFAIGRLVHRGHRHFGEHAGARGIGIVLFLLLIGLVVTAAVLLVRHYSTQRGDTRTSAEQMLAERFARGEIDEAEFVRRRDTLRG